MKLTSIITAPISFTASCAVSTASFLKDSTYGQGVKIYKALAPQDSGFIRKTLSATLSFALTTALVISGIGLAVLAIKTALNRRSENKAAVLAKSVKTCVMAKRVVDKFKANVAAKKAEEAKKAEAAKAEEAKKAEAAKAKAAAAATPAPQPGLARRVWNGAKGLVGY